MTSTTTFDDDSSYFDDFTARYSDQCRLLGRFNLAVFGKTGAGKSSLVNAMFGCTVAQTGIGKPVTLGTTYYQHPSGVFGMFDCVGFETGESGDDILRNLKKEIELTRSLPLEDQMHVAWYVVRWSDRRFEDGQAAFVRELHTMGLPVVFVLSQVPLTSSGQVHPDAEELAEAIRVEVGDIIEGGRPVFTNAVADPHLGQSKHGLFALLGSTFRAAPAGVRSALTAAQRIDLKRKRDDCLAIVAAGTAAAAGIGAVPIPFSDAALLIPAQVTMMATISARYALPIDAGTVSSLAAAAALAGFASMVGRLLANCAKFIPGFGSLLGGAINATIAATLTAGIGLAWIAVCEHLVTLSPEEIEALLGDKSGLRQMFMNAFNAQVKAGIKVLPGVKEAAA
jgi:uncharacterized protein (DUF697 family)/predicted GTPase